MVQKPFFWGLVLGYASPITWATDAWRFQVGHPSKKYPPVIVIFPSNITMKSLLNPMKSPLNPMKWSWNHHEIIMKSSWNPMDLSWNHPFSSIFMPWGAWLGFRHGQGLVSLRCFWAARRFGIRCQLGTANGKRGASDEIPGPLGPLGSPWARKKIQIGHGFFVGFQEKSGI